MSAQTAKDAKAYFADNVQRFGSDPNAQPEKYNLYRGLHALAEALEEFEVRIQRIEAQLGR